MFSIRLLREFTVHRDAWKRQPVLCDTSLMAANDFHLEIHGLPAFLAFVAVLRGQDVTPEQLATLVARVHEVTAKAHALQAAEQATSQP